MARKVEEAERLHFETIKSLYEKMFRIRAFELALIPYINNGEIVTPCHLCIGQEVVAVGVCAALEPEDYVFGNHRSHGHYLAKGGDMKRLALEIFGKAGGCSNGYGGSMHICDPEVNFMGTASIVGGTIGLAVGAAKAIKLRKEKRISVVFFGDGATCEGVFYESLNLAALYELPVLFVLEDNGYSTHMKYDDIYGGLPREMVRAFMDAWYGSNDAVILKRQVYELRDSLPSLLHCKTYRLCGHVGPGDNINGEIVDIRPKEEIETAWREDPLHNWSDYITPVQAALIEKEVQEIIEYARKAPYPKKGSFKKNVFRDNIR